jgi:hypothetical protein
MPTATMTASTRTVVYHFDVTRHGGRTGEHPMTGDPIPPGAVIIDALLRVEGLFVPGQPRSAAPRDVATVALVAGGRSLCAPVMPSPATWPVGRVKRLELTAAGRAVPADGPVAVAVGGVGGFLSGALLLALTVLELPPPMKG